MPIKEKIADTFVSAMLNSNELNVRLKCLDKSEIEYLFKLFI